MARVVTDPGHPAGLVGDDRALGQTDRDRVVDLLGGQHRQDLVELARPDGFAAVQGLELAGEVGGRDQVVEAGLAGLGVLDASADLAAGDREVGEQTVDRLEPDRAEQDVGGEVGGPHDRPVAPATAATPWNRPAATAGRRCRRTGRSRTTSRRAAEANSLLTATSRSRSSLPASASR